MSHVWRLLPCEEEDRPDLELSDFDGDWDELLGSDLASLALVTTQPGLTLEFYALAGTLGVASGRLARALIQLAGGRLRGRPTLVDGRRFQILLVSDPVDALDRERSELTVFRSNSNRIKQVRAFVFRPSTIPAEPFVFTIPESPALLLANEAAVDQLREDRYPGLDFASLP